VTPTDADESSPKRPGDDRKLIRINGVRAYPGCPVRFQELLDGWATFTDFGANGRRLQRILVVCLIVLFGALVVDEKVIGPNDTQIYLIVAIVAVVIVLWATQLVSDEQAFFSRLRLRPESARRTGGAAMLRQAINKHGRARTVGQMNVLVSSLGRKDPVFSLRRVQQAQVRKSWWRTTVTLELNNGKELTYRVVGVRAPAKLAAAFERGRLSKE
jgi:hypothetical protein